MLTALAQLYQDWKNTSCPSMPGTKSIKEMSKKHYQECNAIFEPQSAHVSAPAPQNTVKLKMVPISDPVITVAMDQMNVPRQHNESSEDY